MRAKRAAFHHVIDRAVHMASGKEDPGPGAIADRSDAEATAKAEVGFGGEGRAGLARAQSIRDWLGRQASIRRTLASEKLDED